MTSNQSFEHRVAPERHDRAVVRVRDVVVGIVVAEAVVEVAGIAVQVDFVEIAGRDHLSQIP